MPVYAKRTKSNFTPAPQGLWAAVCCDVVDLGNVTTQFGTAPMVKIWWQLEDLDPATGRPFLAGQRYRLSLHEKANLCKMLESWRGRKFTEEEAENFELDKLIGVNCQIQIIHNLKPGGAVFANVQAVVPAARGTVKLVVRDYVRHEERAKQANYEAHPDGEADETIADDSWVPF